MPNAASNERSSSTGRAAPPLTQIRSELRSYRSRSGWCSSAAYMVGTPSNTVTRQRWMISSAWPGSNRASRASAAPEFTAVFSPQVSPNTWNSGRHPMTTSDGLRLNSVSALSWALVRRLAWLSSAPLGCPVVPEVYRISAVSSSARSATPGAGS